MKKLPDKLVFLIIILIIICFLIFLEKINFLDFFYYLSTPLQRIFSITLPSQTDQLKRQNVELLAEIAKLKEIERENQILREQLGLEEKEDWQLISASIIGRNQVLVIDKGEKQGIKPGQPVIAQGGLLIGQIIETFPISSKVLLITNPQSEINALAQVTRAQGIVKGEYGLGLKMEMIPQDKEIHLGDIVITSGLDGQFPKGLIIGTIETINRLDNQIFQKAILQPTFSFRDLETVFVILER